MNTLEKKLAKTSVLVVDDQKFLRNILSEMLRNIGVQQVHMAEEGEEGISQFKTWLPGIVFTDWNMPGMSGLDFTKWIRNSPQSPNSEVPVIMLTANNHQRHITQARDAGVSELIVKPIVPQNVVSRLQKVLFNPRRFITSASYRGPDRRRRQNVNYKGPLRRLTDPIVVNKKSPEAQKVVGEIHSLTKEMSKIVDSLDVTDRKQVLGVYNQAQSTQKLAQESEDQDLEKAASSLSQYIETMGASGLMEQRVVRAHLQALTSLIHLPDHDASNRSAVVKHLLALVQKKVRGASSS